MWKKIDTINAHVDMSMFMHKKKTIPIIDLYC